MIWTIIGAAIMFFALIGVAFAANAYYDAPLSGRWRGPDGYPILRDYHAERCPCDRCIWVMRGTIDRLERELGIGEYAGREETDEGRVATGATVRIGELDMSRLTAESVTADKLFPPTQVGVARAKTSEFYTDEHGMLRTREVGPKVTDE